MDPRIVWMLAAVVTVLIVFGYYASTRSYRALKRERAGRDFSSFKAEFKPDEYPADALWETYEDLAGSRGVSISRKDDLKLTLGFAPDELMWIIDGRVQKLDAEDIFIQPRIRAHKPFTRHDPSTFVIKPFVRYFPVKKVEDYVRLLTAIRAWRKTGTASQSTAAVALHHSSEPPNRPSLN